MITGFQEKQLNIECNIAQPDDNTSTDEINAWLALRIKNELMKDAVE
jgi:ribonuclease PH